MVNLKVMLVIDETLLEHGRAIVRRRWLGKIQALRAAGCEPILVTLRDGYPITEDARSAGFTAYSLGSRNYLDLPWAVLRLTRLIRKHKVDVVHGQMVIPSIVASLAAIIARRGTRIYFRTHTTSRGRLTGASRLAARLSHFTMGGSAAVGECARALDKSPADRIRIAENGVSDLRMVGAQEIADLRARLNIQPQSPVVVIVANLREEKGHPVLFAAMARVGESLQELPHVVVVGEGPERDRLVALAGADKRFKTHFVGHQDDIAPYYALADVVALPSHKDAAPLSALESMAAGKPLVASRVGGLRKWLADEQTGRLVDPDNPQQLAETLVELLNAPSLREALGSAARRRFEERFTIEAMAHRWRRTYLGMQQESKRR